MTPQEISKNLVYLGKLYYDSDGVLPVIKRGSQEWAVWRSWRKLHGLSVAFMDTREEYTVPSMIPPEDIPRVLGAAPRPQKRALKPKYSAYTED